MQIIKEIRIGYFRSFSQKIEIKQIKDLNIFSGKNDSGKSNILRALNLFFSEEKVDFYHQLNFFKDFSKFRAEQAKDNKIKKQIEVAIHFNRCNFSGAVLPESFWVEKAWDKDGNLLYRKIKNSRGQILRYRESTSKVDSSITSFLKKIHFFHVPAIKDTLYLEYLKREYQNSLLFKIASDNEYEAKIVGNKITSKNTTVKQITDMLTEKINQEADEMMRSFKSTTSEILETKFYIPELDYSKVLEVTTEKNIPLSLRGDGVQAKLIPELLNEICKNRNADYVIWGFEEPENSFEYGNAQKLADLFLNSYSKKNQIFITSHAFNFVTLIGDNVSTFRVWKANYNEGTQVTNVNIRQPDLIISDAEILDEELGVFSLNQELEKIFSQKIKQLEELKVVRAKLEINSKPVLYVEDRYDQIFKIAWLKLKNIPFTKQNLEEIFDKKCQFRIISAAGANNLQGFLQANNQQLWQHLKIIGLFDFDQKGVETFHLVKKKWKSEIEFLIIEGHSIVHPQNQNLMCMLLPIPQRLSELASLDYPASYVAIEQLLQSDFLDTSQYVKTKPLVGGYSLKFVEDDKKSKFWERLINVDKNVFKDFKPLFERVER